MDPIREESGSKRGIDKSSEKAKSIKDDTSVKEKDLLEEPAEKNAQEEVQPKKSQSENLEDKKEGSEPIISDYIPV